jgi:hypothetical protein
LIKTLKPQTFVGLAAGHLFACRRGIFFCEAYLVADHRDGTGQTAQIPGGERSA